MAEERHGQQPICSVHSLTKSFFGNVVVDDVTIEIRENEFHGLVGENGAGKSTLINMISGMLSPESGTIVIHGESFDNITPLESAQKRISVVHQELSYFPHLSVAENIFQGRELIGKSRVLRGREMRSITRRLLEDVGLNHIEPHMAMVDLSLAELQMIEFIKALYQEPKMLILDEATSALDPGQVKIIFNRLRRYREEHGLSIIFISHRLGEIYELCDTITVLKDGKHVVTKPASDISLDEMIKSMTGRQILDIFPPKPPIEEVMANDIVLEAKNVFSTHLKDISFDLRRSEILGIGGLQGQGQGELMELLFGARPILSGELIINGCRFSKIKPIQSIKNSVAYIPSERKTEGLFQPFSVKDNIVSISFDKISHPFSGTINRKAEKKLVDNSIESLNVRCTGPNQIVRYLSGGNQQKVVLAKWLERQPSIMLLNEPTRGIDIGTKQEIYNIMRNLVKDGVSIILISSDALEMVGLCDRAIILYENRINAEVVGDDLTEETLVHASVVSREEMDSAS